MAYCKSLAAVALLMFCGLPALVTAQARSKPALLAPGAYATERSWGNIDITRQGDRQLFKLFTAGGDARACLMQGEITGRTARLPTGAGSRICELRFTKTGSGFRLEEISKNGQCGDFCGPDARFAGQYYRVAAACQSESLRREQERARILVENKAFVSARDRLRPLLRDCAKTLDPWTEAHLRNDLAGVLLRLGDLRGCRDTLSPLEDHAARGDSEIRRSYPQAEADMIIDLLVLTRMLLDQCPARP